MADTTAVTVKSKQQQQKFSYSVGYTSVGGEGSRPGQVTYSKSSGEVSVSSPARIPYNKPSNSTNDTFTLENDTVITLNDKYNSCFNLFTSLIGLNTFA